MAEEATPTSTATNYEVMFKNRYTETDPVYANIKNVISQPPPCIFPWYSRPKRTFDYTPFGGGGSRGGGGGHHGGGGHYGGGGDYRRNPAAGGDRRPQDGARWNSYGGSNRNFDQRQNHYSRR